jgi:hypothetical protein
MISVSEIKEVNNIRDIDSEEWPEMEKLKFCSENILMMS